MEPESNASYAKKSYWDDRYTTEEQYDWFPSIYDACVDAVFESVEEVHRKSCSNEQNFSHSVQEIKVLHLGTGNSALCADLFDRYSKKYAGTTAPYRLLQVAIDYSEVVIARMQAKYTSVRPSTSEQNSSSTNDQAQVPTYLPDVVFAVADVCDLSTIRTEHGPFFDLVVDKGTMDALQADHVDEEKIHAMLTEVSSCLGAADSASEQDHHYRQFVQITWEQPYYRLFYTVPKEPGTTRYIWDDKVRHRPIGESDMYKLYVYEVNA